MASFSIRWCDCKILNTHILQTWIFLTSLKTLYHQIVSIYSDSYSSLPLDVARITADIKLLSGSYQVWASAFLYLEARECSSEAKYI